MRTSCGRGVSFVVYDEAKAPHRSTEIDKIEYIIVYYCYIVYGMKNYSVCFTSIVFGLFR